jgi:hypothetical protein
MVGVGGTHLAYFSNVATGLSRWYGVANPFFSRLSSAHKMRVGLMIPEKEAG